MVSGKLDQHFFSLELYVFRHGTYVSGILRITLSRINRNGAIFLTLPNLEDHDAPISVGRLKDLLNAVLAKRYVVHCLTRTINKRDACSVLAQLN